MYQLKLFGICFRSRKKEFCVDNNYKNPECTAPFEYRVTRIINTYLSMYRINTQRCEVYSINLSAVWRLCGFWLSAPHYPLSQIYDIFNI